MPVDSELISLAKRPVFSDDAPQVAPDFDSVYREHFVFVFRCLRGMGLSSSQAEDAAQDAFIVVHRKLADFRVGSPMRPWLFGIAYRVARDHRRTARRKTNRTVSSDHSNIASNKTPFDSAAKAEAVDRIERFLSTLDEDRRWVFVLSEIEQMTAPEIEQALGVKLNTVYSRLRAARAEFAAFVARQKGARRG